MSRDPDKVNHPPPGPGTPDPLAASLARLDPAPAALNRDRLMFQAGAESRRTVIRLWQLTAGLMAAVGFFAGMRYGSSGGPERVVYIDRDPAPATAIPPAPASAAPDTSASPATPHPGPGVQLVEWLQIRNDVLTGGLGLLPDPGHQSSSSGPLPRGADASAR